MRISWPKCILALSIIFAMSTIDDAAARKGGERGPGGAANFKGPPPSKEPQKFGVQKFQPLNPKTPKKGTLPVAKETSKTPKKTAVSKTDRCVNSFDKCGKECAKQHGLNSKGHATCSSSCVTIMNRCLNKAGK